MFPFVWKTNAARIRKLNDVYVSTAAVKPLKVAKAELAVSDHISAYVEADPS
jgi:hypothetical protein